MGRSKKAQEKADAFARAVQQAEDLIGRSLRGEAVTVPYSVDLDDVLSLIGETRKKVAASVRFSGEGSERLFGVGRCGTWRIDLDGAPGKGPGVLRD